MHQRKVFVVSRGYHDYEGAKFYGEVIFMNTDVVNRTAVSNIVRKFQPFIDESHENDFIVMTGLSIMCSIACTLFALRHKRLNILLFDTQKEYYLARTILFTEQNEKEEANAVC